MILPLAERLGRRALEYKGVASRRRRTSVADLHFYDARGDGSLPTVVLLHGISSAATPFGRVLLEVRKHVRRVIVPDAAAHGFSGRPAEPLTLELLLAATTELLDAELDEPAVVFGNSLGGAVALRYALERRARVRGVVVCSPAGARMEPHELELLLASFRLETPAAARAFVQKLYHRPPWWSPLIAADIRALFSRTAIRQLTSAVRAEHGFEPEELRALDVPTLLLWGRSDRLMPRAHLDWFRQHLPAHAKIEEPEGFGHCPHLEQPRRLATRIVEFARSLPQ
jgi:pimeloyl-ACP methyl ester carboxylesterase